ncbi:ABC transporter ATP-binding protein [Alteromonas gracilis]
MATLAISASGIRAGYGRREVLQDVSLQVEPGQVAALLGPNGAGKTTALNCLGGLRGVSAGEVVVLGERDPARAGAHWRSRVSYVRQSWSDHGGWKVARLLTWLARHYPVARSGPDELLERVGLTAARDQRIEALSGGQRRRLDLAIGLLGSPEVMLLDEPTAGLDPEGCSDVMEIVAQESERGTAVLISTHDIAEVERVASGVVILRSGVVVAHGTPRELAARFSTGRTVRWRDGGRWRTAQPEQHEDFVSELVGRGVPRDDIDVEDGTLADTYRRVVAAPAPARDQPLGSSR